MVISLNFYFKKGLNIETGKIDLNFQLKILYGQHRSGWLYALNGLKFLHNPQGVIFDSFIERTFVWNPDGVKPHKKPWIGVIHIPPNVPEWFMSNQSNDQIFKLEVFKESLPFCQGLFTLSSYHKESLEKKLNIPINNLFFSTEIPKVQWDWDAFLDNKDKKIVQIGWWLRKLHTIYQLETKKYKKCNLKVSHVKQLDQLMEIERKLLKKEGAFSDVMYKTVENIGFLKNRDYDILLSENLILVDLYDTSANNLITECMARNTPVLVNPLPAIVEYLGKDYPLYFNSISEASEKADDLDLILETYKYLKNHPNKKKLHNRNFYQEFINSEIYRSLPNE